MGQIFGYGEDAFTFWALKHKTPIILNSFQDQTAPSDCLYFYRPSFGRSGGEKSAEFGEFDAIIGSLENIYLIESKWDNLYRSKRDKIIIRKEQELRHLIFSWYLVHWDNKYSDNWSNFVKEYLSDFQRKYRKIIAPTGSVLATNLEFILHKLLDHCKGFSSEDSIRNVLLFFFNKDKSKPLSMIDDIFRVVNMDYSQDVVGNFITLD